MGYIYAVFVPTYLDHFGNKCRHVFHTLRIFGYINHHNPFGHTLGHPPLLGQSTQCHGQRGGSFETNGFRHGGEPTRYVDDGMGAAVGCECTGAGGVQEVEKEIAWENCGYDAWC